MNKLKSRIVTVALLMLVLSCLALLCACGEVGLSELYVGKEGLPRKTTYVEGQELDLAGGVITAVNEDGETSEIPMTAETVTVTGYDKSVIGKQTVTVTYDGKSTTFEVTVVARLTAENYEVNYFVGDTFDNTKGKLKIYRDDATSFSVNMNDSSVSILPYDFSKAGKVTVSVKCTATDGQEYTGGFEVTVHDIAELELKAPTKKVYSSHETFDFTGSYFTVKAGGGSNFTKYVNVTKDMISGFNPEAVTKANLTTPVNQTVIINYAGRQFEFPVSIYYSGVYLVEAAATELSFYDWSDVSSVVVDEEHGEIALEAIRQYYSLSVFDQALIDEDVLATVIRPATVYLHSLYIKEFERYSDAFVLSSSGFAVVAKSYEAVEEALANLENENDLFNVYAVLLRDLYDDFGELEYNETTKLNSLVFVHTEEYNELIISLFTYMLELHDMLAEFPEEWDVDTLAENEDEINDVVTKITSSGFGGYQYIQIYRLVSSWREQDDYLEIIYSYYMYVLENGRDELMESVWKTVPFPGVLCDWYMAMSQAANEASNMAKYKDSTAYLHDVSIFMLSYFEALSLADDIKNHENTLYYDIYTLMEGDALFERDLRGAEFGYLYHMGAGLDSERITELWDNYLELLNVFMTNSAISTREYEAQFKGMFASLVELSPSELYDFINSLHFLYNTSRGMRLVLDCREGARSYFVYILASYYSNTATEDAFAMFQKLLVAMENYALVGQKEAALADFKSLMEELEDDYNALSAADRQSFNTYFGDCYEKYLLIYEIETGAKDVDLGAFEDRFAEFKSLIDLFDEVLNHINNSETADEEKNQLVPVLFALYEKASSIHNEIISSGNAELIGALDALKFTFEDGDKSLDRQLCRIKGIVVSFLVNSYRTIGEASYRTWDIYSASSLDSFLVDIAYLMFQGYKGSSSDNIGDIDQIMEDFRAMSNDDKNAFLILGFANRYYAAIQIYFTNVYDDAAIVKALLEAEIAYVTYVSDVTNSEKLESFIEKFEALEDLYDALADKTSFDETFKAFYDYYLEQYDVLTAEQVA